MFFPGLFAFVALAFPSAPVTPPASPAFGVWLLAMASWVFCWLLGPQLPVVLARWFFGFFSEHLLCNRALSPSVSGICYFIGGGCTPKPARPASR